jgi:hypothetical protein
MFKIEFDFREQFLAFLFVFCFEYVEELLPHLSLFLSFLLPILFESLHRLHDDPTFQTVPHLEIRKLIVIALQIEELAPHG